MSKILFFRIDFWIDWNVRNLSRVWVSVLNISGVIEGLLFVQRESHFISLKNKYSVPFNFRNIVSCSLCQLKLKTIRNDFYYLPSVLFTKFMISIFHEVI